MGVQYFLLVLNVYLLQSIVITFRKALLRGNPSQM